MYLFQYRRALLQTKDHVLLNQSKLYIRSQSLKLSQLLVRLLQQAFLILLPPQSKQGSFLIAIAQAFLGNVGLTGGDGCNALLVLVEFVALDLHVQDSSVGGASVKAPSIRLDLDAFIRTCPGQ